MQVFHANIFIAMNFVPILESHNPWWREPATRVALHRPVRRDLQPKVLNRVLRTDDRRAVLLLGPRQVGKTTLLKQVIDELLDKGFPPANILYFDFSDDRLVGEVTAREVTETIPAGLDDSLPRTFFLDEISQAPRWDRWLKQAVDKGIGRIVATDSAASLLRDGSRESGQGRWDELRMEGLSFGEFLRLHERPGEGDEPRMSARAYERYLALGGFPEHVLSEDLPQVRSRLRSDVVERAILRDLAGRVDDPRRVRDLFVYLMQDSGSQLVSSHRADDLSADPRTVEAWVGHLQDTFLVSRLEQRRLKAAKRLRSKPKLYAADHGLVSAFAASPDPVNDPEVRGKVFEALVYRHLRGLDLEPEPTYLRIDDDLEVDFVIDLPAGPVLVEVTSSRRVRDEKLARLEKIGERVGAVKRVLIHGGISDGAPAERAEDGPMILPLFRFLSKPEIVLPGEENT